MRDRTMFDVVVVGSVNLDLVARASRIPHPGETIAGSSYDEFPGGKGLNQAVAAARAGASVALVAAIGDDSAGNMTRELVRSEGIDDSWVRTLGDHPTGRALIVVADNAENSIVVVPGANAHVEWPATRRPAGRVVLGQLEVPVSVIEASFTSSRVAGATTILNPAPATHLPQSLIDTCSLIVPNEHEVGLLGGGHRLLGTLSLDAVIITRGAHGVDIVRRADSNDRDANDHRATDHVAAFDVEPIDTTGAGDAFCGNLAAQLALGASRSDAVRWAAAAGALATTVRGAVPSLPTQRSVADLLASAP
jgi:ribokinase